MIVALNTVYLQKGNTQFKYDYRDLCTLYIKYSFIVNEGQWVNILKLYFILFKHCKKR